MCGAVVELSVAEADWWWWSRAPVAEGGAIGVGEAVEAVVVVVVVVVAGVEVVEWPLAWRWRVLASGMSLMLSD